MSDVAPQINKREVATEVYMRQKGVPEQLSQQASPEDRRIAKVAAKVKEKLDQGKWREGLEIPSQPKFDEAPISLRIDQIGVQRDQNGDRVLTAREQGWQAQARTDLEVITKVLDGKFNENDPIGISYQQRGDLRTAVIDAITRNPEMARKFYSLQTLQERMAYIDSHILDPKFLTEVRKGLQVLVNTPEFQDNFTEADLNLRLKERERVTVAEEVRQIERTMQIVERSLQAHAAAGPGGVIGRRASELRRVQGELDLARRDLVGLRNQKETVDQEVQDLKDEIAIARSLRDNAEVARLNALLVPRLSAQRRAANDLSQRQADINERQEAISGIGSERSALEARLQDLARDRVAKQKELDNLDIDIQKGRITVADALRVREAAEQAFAARLHSVWGDAATVLANEDLEAAAAQVDNVLNEIEGEIKSNAAEAGKNKIRSFLTTTVDTNHWGRKKSRKVIDKAKARRYSSDIIDKGPEAVAYDILTATINPDSDSAHPQNYTPEEARALTQNKEFMKEFEPIMAREIFGRMLRSGSKFTPEDEQRIVESEWGMRMVSSALEGNQMLRDEAQKLFGEDVVKNPGKLKRFAYEAGGLKNFLALIFLPVAGAVALGYQAHKAGRPYA